MGLKKVKFGKITSVLQNKWFVVSVRPSSYGYTWEVSKHSCDFHTLLMLSNLPRVFLTRLPTECGFGTRYLWVGKMKDPGNKADTVNPSG